MDGISIYRVPCGPIGTNSYIAAKAGRGDAVVVDPADDVKLTEKLTQLGLQCTAILLTHGHFDHISGLDMLRKAQGCPVYVGEGDADMLCNAQKNGSIDVLGSAITSEPADLTVKDGQKLSLAGMEFLTIGCTGHTKGGMSYLVGDALFSGDTLFRRGIGRTDLDGGDVDEIFSSVLKLYGLPEETEVLPGHGGPTTIGEEAQKNPFVRRN